MRAHPCYRCGTDNGAVERVGRRDVCLGCGSDLHCCRNCSFYEPGSHNQCREPQAERQVEKEQANFCEYFNFGKVGGGSDDGVGAGDARARLDALFRSKGN